MPKENNRKKAQKYKDIFDKLSKCKIPQEQADFLEVLKKFMCHSKQKMAMDDWREYKDEFKKLASCKAIQNDVPGLREMFKRDFVIVETGKKYNANDYKDLRKAMREVFPSVTPPPPVTPPPEEDYLAEADAMILTWTVVSVVLPFFFLFVNSLSLSFFNCCCIFIIPFIAFRLLTIKQKRKFAWSIAFGAAFFLLLCALSNLLSISTIWRIVLYLVPLILVCKYYGRKKQLNAVVNSNKVCCTILWIVTAFAVLMLFLSLTLSWGVKDFDSDYRDLQRFEGKAYYPQFRKHFLKNWEDSYNNNRLTGEQREKYEKLKDAVKTPPSESPLSYSERKKSLKDCLKELAELPGYMSLDTNVYFRSGQVTELTVAVEQQQPRLRPPRRRRPQWDIVGGLVDLRLPSNKSYNLQYRNQNLASLASNAKNNVNACLDSYFRSCLKTIQYNEASIKSEAAKQFSDYLLTKSKAQANKNKLKDFTRYRPRWNVRLDLYDYSEEHEYVSHSNKNVTFDVKVRMKCSLIITDTLLNTARVRQGPFYADATLKSVVITLDEAAKKGSALALTGKQRGEIFRQLCADISNKLRTLINLKR